MNMGLHKKIITDKNGKRTTVWVSDNKNGGAVQSSDKQNAIYKRIEDAYNKTPDSGKKEALEGLKEQVKTWEKLGKEDKANQIAAGNAFIRKHDKNDIHSRVRSNEDRKKQISSDEHSKNLDGFKKELDSARTKKELDAKYAEIADRKEHIDMPTQLQNELSDHADKLEVVLVQVMKEAKADLVSSSELFPTEMIDKLRNAYKNVERVNPNGALYNKLNGVIQSLSKEKLQQVADGNIKWMSYEAKKRIKKEGGK